MISDSTSSAPDFPRISTEEIPVDGAPVFRERREIADYFGDRFDVQRGSLGERGELLETMRERSPELNGNIEQALEQIRLNTEQLNKKESFIKKMGKAGLEALKFPFKHPVLTTAGIVALIYFTGGGGNIISYLEGLAGSVPDAKTKTIAEGLKSLGGSSSAGIGINPYAGIEGTGIK